eukprot:Amastigsp_a177017_13.p5 type:complete len:164 gc:universal Amastigsp_a177017_13:513-1004(+)
MPPRPHVLVHMDPRGSLLDRALDRVADRHVCAPSAVDSVAVPPRGHHRQRVCRPRAPRAAHVPRLHTRALAQQHSHACAYPRVLHLCRILAGAPGCGGQVCGQGGQEVCGRAHRSDHAVGPHPRHLPLGHSAHCQAPCADVVCRDGHHHVHVSVLLPHRAGLL